MKFKALSVYKKNGKATSMHAIFGCKEAKAFNLTDSKGMLRDVECIPRFGGCFLSPVLQRRPQITYEDFTSSVCFNGKIYFGNASNSTDSVSWYVKNEADIPKAFKQAVDKYTEKKQADELAELNSIMRH